MDNADVVVIGAGPAGLAAAIALTRIGLGVTIIDSQTGPIDKACGEGLLPDGLAAAARLAIDIPACLGATIEGIRFIAGKHSVQAPFPNADGLGIRRLRLHQVLTQQATNLGATVLWNTPVTGIEANHVITAQGSLNARWIIIADGERSRFRTLLGFDAPPRRQRYAYRQHFAIAPWSCNVEVHWGNRFQLYVTPVSANEIGIAVLADDPGVRVARAIAHFPIFASRLANATQSSSERGAITTTRQLPTVVCDNIALIGDASGTVDAITGEGIGLAFLQAEALAQALASGNLQLYAVAHRHIARRPKLMAELMLGIGNHPRVAALSVATLSAVPSLFRQLVALHVRGI